MSQKNPSTDSDRPYVHNNHNTLRKIRVPKRRSPKIHLGKAAEVAGFEPGDKAIVDSTEDGTIAVIEAPENPPEDARSISSDSFRISLPPTLLSTIGIDLEKYNPSKDPVIVDLEPFPDEEGEPSAIEVYPLGFESGITNDEGQLLPQDEWNPNGADEPAEANGERRSEQEGPREIKTDSGRPIDPDIGVSTSLVDMALQRFSVEKRELQDAAQDIANVSTIEDTIDEWAVGVIEKDPQTVYFIPESQWDDIVEERELSDTVADALQSMFEKETELLAHDSKYNLESEGTTAVVISSSS